jgi:hypothetical protein
LSLGEPRGNLLMCQELSPDVGKGDLMVVQHGTRQGLPLVQVLVHELCPMFGGVGDAWLFQAIGIFELA